MVADHDDLGLRIKEICTRYDRLSGQAQTTRHHGMRPDLGNGCLEPGQVGLSTCPVAEMDKTSTNVLGATNLYVNAKTQREEAS